MVMGTECTKKVDIWALGVLTYELSNLYFPFANSDIDDPRRFAKVVL
jgi:serine/threonine protein kinase